MTAGDAKGEGPAGGVGRSAQSLRAAETALGATTVSSQPVIYRLVYSVTDVAGPYFCEGLSLPGEVGAPARAG